MSTPDTHTTAPKVRSSKAECCDELTCDSGLRNKYYDGKRLTTKSFQVERDFLEGRRLLINRAIHGWGVVYGYPVESADGRVSIGSGLAFDKCGRELLQVGGRKIELADLLVLDKNRSLADRDKTFAAAQETGSPSGKVPARACWLLSVHYAERDEGSVRINDPCSCEREEYDRVCETVSYSLRHVPCAECCADFACELTCDCGTGHCCDELNAAKDEHGHRGRGKRPQRGGCGCLCDHLAELSFDACTHRLWDVPVGCGTMRVDLKNGVPLACVTLARDDCGDLKIGQVLDACGPRRLVKRNDLLFDLIRGCDVTRISEIGWADWHRQLWPPVPFEDFRDALGPEGDEQAEYITKLFWVRFSRPVRTETLLADCFSMTVMSFEREGGWWETRRVPILRIEAGGQPNDPGYATEARIVVDGRWFEDAVWGTRTVFDSGDTWIEIEVRGDLIVDCNGQTVDANAVGLSPAPTGNGTPGGTFLSSFRVAASEPPARTSTYDRAARVKGASS